MYSALVQPGRDPEVALAPRHSPGLWEMEPVRQSRGGSVDGEHLRMVEQAVEDGGCEDLIVQQLCPLRKGLMAGQDHAPVLVAATEPLAEVVGFRPLQADLAPLIPHSSGRLHIGLQCMLELVALLRCLEVRHEVIQGGDVDRDAVLARSHGQGHRSMGLPGPGGPRKIT
jgi:hypothetical protein